MVRDQQTAPRLQIPTIYISQKHSVRNFVFYMNQAAHHLVPVIDSILDTDTSEWDRRQNYNNTFFHLVLDDFMQLKPSPHSSTFTDIPEP